MVVQDRAAFDYLPLRTCPSIPETGEGEQIAAVYLETIRLFRLAVFLPLVKPIRWNQATMRFERLPERGGSCGCFGPGIDRLVPDSWIACPRRHEPPDRSSRMGLLAS